MHLFWMKQISHSNVHCSTPPAFFCCCCCPSFQTIQAIQTLFTSIPLKHANRLHYYPAKPSLWRWNPASHSTKTSKRFALMSASQSQVDERPQHWQPSSPNSVLFLRRAFVSIGRDVWLRAGIKQRWKPLSKINTHKFSAVSCYSR